MSDLPPGFVLQDDLPPGFVVEPPKKKFGLEDTWPAKLAKSIYSAVTLPGDVAQGNVSITGEDGHTNPAVIDRSAELASVASPLSPAARMGVGWAGALKTEKASAPSGEALKSAATEGYDKARNLGVEIAPQGISKLGEKIGASLNEMGVDGELAPKTFGILNRIKNPPEEAVATVSNLETLRRSLGHAAGDFANPTEQLASRHAREHLADYLAAIPDQDVIRGPASEVSGLIKSANGNYAAFKRSEGIGDALQKAELQTAATHSGRNLDNKTRQAFVKILTNDKAGAGFAKPELDAAESVVRGSKPADWMRSIGNILGGGGGLGALHAAATGATAGFAAGSFPGAAVGLTAPLVGYALKKGADASTMRAVKRLDEMVRARSPLGESLPQTVTGSVSPQKAALARSLMLGVTPQQ